MESLQILRLWAACAWSDRELHPAEAEALRRFIAASHFDEGQRAEAEALLEAPPGVDAAAVAELSSDAREGVYRAALRIVELDRVVKDGERAFLARLRASLALDDETLAKIESE